MTLKEEVHPAKGTILHVNRYLMIGGAEYYIVNMIRAMPQYRHVVLIRRADVSEEMVGVMNSYGVNPRLIKDPSMRVTKEMVQEISPSIVIWHSSEYIEGEPNKGYMPEYKWFKVWHGAWCGYMPRYDKNVAVSQDAERNARRRGTMSGLVVCRGCVPWEDYQQSRTERPTVIGRYGSDRPEKHDAANPEILAAADNGDVRYLMVGGHSQKPLFETAGIATKTTWVEASTTRKYEYLAGMDIALYRNSQRVVEGLSISILEMMAAGIVIVAEARGGNSESIVHGETGFLVPWEDKAQFSRHLRYLLDNPEIRKKMGEAARERARTMFGLKNLNDAWESAIGG